MYKIGIDLGGTNIACGMIDENYKIVAKSNAKTGKNRTAFQIIDDMVKVATDVMKAANVSSEQVDFCGIGIPGWVDKDNGVVIHTTNLNMSEVPLVKIMEERLGIPCGLENDANAAAIGEFVAGSGKGSKNFVAITLGTGVGGAVIINNKIITGVNYAAGEIGHMVIKYDGLKCACGRNGCYEQYASVTALIRQTVEAMENDKSSKMWEIAKTVDDVSGLTAFDGMRAGDKTATEVVNQYIKYIAIGAINIINIFQPDIICIGGGISKEGDTLVNPLQRIVERYRFSDNHEFQTKIIPAMLSNDAGIIGAALSKEIS